MLLIDVWSRGRVMARRPMTALFSIVLACAGAAAHADSARRVQFNIAAQALSSALAQFSSQAGLQFTAPGAALSNVKSTGVRGEYSTDAALDLLLKGTGFTYRFVDEGTVAISEVGGQQSAAAGLNAEMRLAQSGADQGQPRSSSAAEGDASKSGKLDEIIVTAQKRSERLQDVPIPVTAISAETLTSRNQLRLQDYYASIPGLNLAPGPYGEPFISIRGITTQLNSNPTVGVAVDEVPFGATTALGGGSSVPDLDPSDLARVEVLRGPQGTLYGANSIGGLIKFVTVDPSSDALSGRVQAVGSSVRHGDEVGYSVRGAVNVPMGDEFAVRVSGFTRRDPGYIDNVKTGKRGVNGAEGHGGLFSALWRPSADFSLKLSALLQDIDAQGLSASGIGLGLGEFQQSVLAGAGGFTRRSEAYTANLAARLGNVDLVSLSGYSHSNWSSVYDYEPILNAPVSLFNDYTANKFTQEIRLSARIGSSVEWLLGGFYTHEDSPATQQLRSIDPATGDAGASLLFVDGPPTYNEYAAFANLTFHVTERFDLQVGGRHSKIWQALRVTINGVAQPITRGRDTAFTYLVTPQFKISPDFMVYARLASGYRPGGPNFPNPVAANPQEFTADTTRNYEIGAKGSFLDRRLTLDASLYFIDWQDIQLGVFRNGYGFYINGETARSRGLELSVEARPLAGLAISGWVAWSDATLTQDFPPGSFIPGKDGDRLPFSPRFSGYLSVEQDFPLTDTWTGFLGGSLSYVGERSPGIGADPAVQVDFPAYEQIDLRAGVKHDAWTASLFLNNVADKRGVLAAGPAIGTSVFYIQPRTVGLAVTRNF